MSEPNKVLANAAAVVALLSHEGALSPADLAEKLGLPRSNVYRLIHGLNTVDLTETLGDTRVRLTARWLSLADSARSSMTEWRSAPAVLGELARSTGLTSYLSVLRDDEATCVDWAPARAIDILALKPGRSLPLYTGAAGRTFLAFGADTEAYLSAAPFPPLTPRSLVTLAQLREDVAATRQQGFALSDEDVTVGVAAVGVPVHDPAGSVVGCLSLGGLREEVLGRHDRLAELLATASRRLPSQG